ncbi:MAG: aromatic aminobenezylarsenical efflux permease ArsG family transporter [Candidatus Coatesbacteria bacterium]
MTDLLLVAGSAFWLGILVSISPCPLACNIAAVSLIGHRFEHRGWVVLSGVLYTAGRSFAYAVLGYLAVSAFSALPSVSRFLQLWMNRGLAVLIVLTGLLLLDFLPVRLPSVSVSGEGARRLERWGLLGVFLMGALFALALCPVSAGLFFGALVPLAVKAQSPLWLSVVFGVGTGLPVVVFAVVLAFAAGRLNEVYLKVQRAELVARKATGAALVFIGVYIMLRYTVGI